MKWLNKTREFLHPPPPERSVRAVLTTTELRVTLADGTTETMPRNTIQEIGIRTTDTGPFVEDVYWAVSDGPTTLHIPQASPDFGTLLEEFGKLSGFSHERVIEAMGCTQNQYFVCWRKSATGSAA
jgi:hypothetical protein